MIANSMRVIVEEQLTQMPWRQLDEFCEVLSEYRTRSRRIYVAGNGGSASTASHFAADLNKFCSPRPGTAFSAVSLTANEALMTALVNDVGWEQAYSHQLERIASEGDLLVVFSVHGAAGSEDAGEWSQNTVRAVTTAKGLGMKTVAFTGFDGGRLAQLVDLSIHIPVNSTPLTEGWHVLMTHIIADALNAQEGSA